MNQEDFERLNKFIERLLYQDMSESDYAMIMRKLGANKRGERYTTICHNVDATKYNLSYKNRQFFCFSECSCSYSLLSLIKKRREILGQDSSTFASLKWLCSELGVDFNFKEENVRHKKNTYDWKSALGKYVKKTSITENKTYDKSILNHLSEIYYEGWVNEGISIETQEKYGIKFYDYKQQIVIPIFDDDGNFIGTHNRNLNPELIEQGMKYDHLRLLNGSEYKFQMGSVLFGLNMNKNDIQATKTAILFESPKAVMMFDSMYDVNNSVGLFGMNLQKYKLKLLVKYGVTHLIIALDRQYKEQNESENSEWDKYKKKINKIIDLARPYMETIEVVYDKDSDRLLNYKDSPIDNGKDIWEKLFNQRELVE